MPTVSIIHFSGSGHTTKLAEAVTKGAASVAGVKTSLIAIGGDDIVKGRYQNDAVFAQLDASDAIIFGSPTYMGGVSADFAKFKDWTSKKWMARAWQDKLAAGFTASASWGGDKQNTLYQLLTLAQQQGMVWIGLGLAPGYNHSKGSPDDLNRTGASLGVMAQANADQGNEGIGDS